MSRVLQVKRGTKTGLPTLSLGELGWCTDTKELYIGNGVGNTLLDPLVDLNGSTGMVVKTGSGTSYTIRTIQGGTGIDISNGDGLSGDPSISVNEGEIDHGGLSGKGNDDHTQYSLANGTRAFTDTVGGVTPTAESHLSTKGYVDSQITNAIQKGSQAISNGSSTVSVTLPSTYADTNYSISLSLKNTTDGSPSQYVMVTTAKSTSGFTVTLSGSADSANYILEWKTTRTIAAIQRGSESLTNGAQSVSVTLPSAYNNTDYSIDYSLLNTIDVNPSQYGMVITAKSTTGFTVKVSGLIDSNNYTFEWSTNND